MCLMHFGPRILLTPQMRAVYWDGLWSNHSASPGPLQHARKEISLVSVAGNVRALTTQGTKPVSQLSTSNIVYSFPCEWKCIRRQKCE